MESFYGNNSVSENYHRAVNTAAQPSRPYRWSPADRDSQPTLFPTPYSLTSGGSRLFFQSLDPLTSETNARLRPVRAGVDGYPKRIKRTARHELDRSLFFVIRVERARAFPSHLLFSHFLFSSTHFPRACTHAKRKRKRNTFTTPAPKTHILIRLLRIAPVGYSHATRARNCFRSPARLSARGANRDGYL